MFQQIGGTEVMVLAVVLLVLVGGKKLPELSRGIAESIREFKKVARE